jgi:hypothetical protein
MIEICEPFGPIYPDLPSVKKFRKMAASAGSVAAMDRAFRQAYGAAVEQAIRAKQRSELQRELPTHRCNCASDTNHNDGEAISAAMRAKHRAALAACPSQERRARPDHVWQALYDLAMAEKRAREAWPLAA